MGAQTVFMERVAQCPEDRYAGPAILDADDRQLLGCLRAFARKAKLAPRLDLDLACALITPASDRAETVYGSTLLRALDALATRSVMFHMGFDAKPSFDELWLLRIVRLFQQGDEAGARFLIAGRVPAQSRHKIAFLASRFAQSLGDAPV